MSKRGKLSQVSLSEYTESLIELTELDGSRVGAFLNFCHPEEGWEERTIKTCYGDLFVICNVLDDYARIIDEHVSGEWAGTVKAAFWEVHAARLRRISNHYAGLIGYDKAAVMERCRKKNEKGGAEEDIGDDALAQWARKQSSKEKPENEGKSQVAPGAARVGGLPLEHCDRVSEQLSLL